MLGIVNGFISLLHSQGRHELTPEECQVIRDAQRAEVNDFFDLIK